MSTKVNKKFYSIQTEQPGLAVKFHDKNALLLVFMNLLRIFETSNILKTKGKRTKS